MKVFKLESDKNPFELTLTEFDDIYKEVALVGYFSTYLTPNITTSNNSFIYNGKKVSIKEGFYNLNSLQDMINRSGCDISFEEIGIQNKIIINKLTGELDFNCENPIAKVLGFENEKLKIGKAYIAKNHPNFLSFHTINVYCEFVDGMLKQSDKFGNIESTLISSFKPNTSFNEPIIYEPEYPLFFLTNWTKTKKVRVELKDENDRPIDLAGALTTIILVLK